MLHSNLTEQSEDKKDPTASAGASPSSEDCSARNIKHTLTSEETNTTGDDRSFSFEVGDPPKVSEKVHRPAWSPFPRSKAALSTEVSLFLSCSLCMSLMLTYHTLDLHELGLTV